MIEVTNDYIIKETVYNIRFVDKGLTPFNPNFPSLLSFNLDGIIIEFGCDLCSLDDKFCLLFDSTYLKYFIVDGFKSKLLHDYDYFDGLVIFGDYDYSISYNYSLAQQKKDMRILINNCPEIDICDTRMGLYVGSWYGEFDLIPTPYYDEECKQWCGGFTENSVSNIVLNQYPYKSDLYCLTDIGFKMTENFVNKPKFDQTLNFQDKNTILANITLMLKLTINTSNIIPDKSINIHNCEKLQCDSKYSTIDIGPVDFIWIYYQSWNRIYFEYKTKTIYLTQVHPMDILGSYSVTIPYYDLDSYNLFACQVANTDFQGDPDLMANLVWLEDYYFEYDSELYSNSIYKNMFLIKPKFSYTVQNSVEVLEIGRCYRKGVQPNTWYSLSGNVTTRSDEDINFFWVVYEYDSKGNIVGDSEQTVLNATREPKTLSSYVFKTGPNTTNIIPILKFGKNTKLIKNTPIKITNLMLKEGLPNIFRSPCSTDNLCEYFYLDSYMSTNIGIQMGYPVIDNVPKLASESISTTLSNGALFNKYRYEPINIEVPCRVLGDTNEEKIDNFNYYIDNIITPMLINNQPDTKPEFYLRYDNDNIYQVVLNDVISYDLKNNFEFTLKFIVPDGEYYNYNLYNNDWQDPVIPPEDGTVLDPYNYHEGLINLWKYIIPVLEININLKYGESLDLVIHEVNNDQKVVIKGYIPNTPEYDCTVYPFDCNSSDPYKNLGLYTLTLDGLNNRVYLFHKLFGIKDDITDNLDVLIGDFKLKNSYDFRFSNHNGRLKTPVWGIQKPLYLLNE